MENRLEKSSNTNTEESQSPNIVPVSGFAAVVNGAMNNNISSGPVHQVNRSIQLLAQKYGSECRNTFEDLSRIVQVNILYFMKYSFLKSLKIILLKYSLYIFVESISKS